MNATIIGLAVGLVLGLVAAFGGFLAFIIVALFGAAGFLVGRFLDGQLDLSRLSGVAQDGGPR
ncbi:hypothetical protein CDG81_22495 [Actinopolyspora erythraea]|uniref:Membrane protein n=1 Tax=Actinopolyspora erythraea TaxID=414996 RepID=A0A099DAD2_9ACTN|nr:hypothetical protein [Actinopolyspora erythraea]ASU81360.1 hypothetical protein CDG81_22495 [Actinopolyspora erythraea]KGI82742.1 membrane protein [Actinopolyspora erythraea]